jgi:hypothetical protein
MGGLDELLYIVVSQIVHWESSLALKAYSDEELGTIGVATSIGHGQQVGLIVSLDEVLILELLSIDGASTSTLKGAMMSISPVKP